MLHIDYLLKISNPTKKIMFKISIITLEKGYFKTNQKHMKSNT